MQTKILWPWEIVEDIDGIAVVADVWGATTNIVTLLEKRVKKLIIVNSDTIEKAKDAYRDALVIGENLDLPKNFFDISNYPSDVAKANVENKTVLYMSNNGSKIIELAFKKGAKKVIAVGFTNINVVSEYLKRHKEKIYLIPAGDAGQRVDEDFHCVISLEKMIKDKRVNLEKAQEESKSFIRDFYADETFDEELNFKVVFNLNSSSTITICDRNKHGFIEVKSLN